MGIYDLKRLGYTLLQACLMYCMGPDGEPVFCSLACGIGGIFGLKTSYDSMKVVYRIYVKPFLRMFNKNKGNVPLLPPP